MDKILSNVAPKGNMSGYQQDPTKASRQEKKRKEDDLLALRKELDRIVISLRGTGSSEAIELAQRMENCENGAWVFDHPSLGPHIRLGKPCNEPPCPFCRDKRQRRAYASSLSAFELLLCQDPHLKLSMITLTAPPLYGDLPAFKKRVTTFQKVMSFRVTVQGIHMTCGQEGPQAHCHILVFHHGDPPTEAECFAKWGGHVDVKTTDNSAKTAASMYSYLYKGYQPSSEGENLSKLPEVSKLMKNRVRVSKAGEALKRAFREAQSGRDVFLSKGVLFSPESVDHHLYPRTPESVAFGSLSAQELDPLEDGEPQC